MSIRATFNGVGVNAPVSISDADSQLFELRAANMNITTDQPFTKNGVFNRYHVTKIVARGVTGNARLAAGGVYTGANKTGTVIVLAAQAWIALSALDKVLDVKYVVLADVLTALPILSLTTASGGACTADILIYGVVLD